MRERIFILSCGEGQWDEVANKKELEQQLKDGDIDDGDLVVYADDVLVAENTTILTREKEEEDKEDGY